MVRPTRAALISKLIVSAVVQTIVLAAMLFGPAETLAWWRAWVFLGVMLAATMAASLGILEANQDLLAERLKPPIQKGQPLWDKIVLLALVASYLAVIVFTPLDVFRFHLLPRPNRIVSSLGLAVFIAGWWIAYLGMRENAFAAPVVKSQEERGHVVVDTGLYRMVRHPMYAGGLWVFLGTPLWLESYAAALLAILPIALLVLRILGEESFLRRELPGYTRYAEQVRYRLLPFIW
jgi:protein-S-isoprenylcysteine O-methyltransferase Ste14